MKLGNALNGDDPISLRPCWTLVLGENCPESYDLVWPFCLEKTITLSSFPCCSWSRLCDAPGLNASVYFLGGFRAYSTKGATIRKFYLGCLIFTLYKLSIPRVRSFLISSLICYEVHSWEERRSLTDLSGSVARFALSSLIFAVLKDDDLDFTSWWVTDKDSLLGLFVLALF